MTLSKEIDNALTLIEPVKTFIPWDYISLCPETQVHKGEEKKKMWNLRNLLSLLFWQEVFWLNELLLKWFIYILALPPPHHRVKIHLANVIYKSIFLLFIASLKY